MGDWTWLDEEFDAVAVDARGNVLPRLVVVIVFALIFAVNMGWRPASLWLAAGLGSALWLFLANRSDAPSRGSVGRRLNRLAEVVTASAVWTALAVSYWLAGDTDLRLLTYGILATLLVVAQTYSFKSLVMTAAFGTLPALSFIFLPWLSGDFSGFKLGAPMACSAMAVGYLISEALRNAANGKALRQARAEAVASGAAAVAANQAKSTFLAMMSHELRTPMNGVLGMAHALTLTRLTARQGKQLDMLVRSGKGLMAILNDLLDISKIEAGKLELEIVAFDLHELAQRVHDLWSETASAKGLRLILEVAPDAPQWVAGDPTRLRQVLVNLVSNAIKFTSDGDVTLAIARTDAGLCVLRVTDTGPGLSEEQQGRLFQAFVQADLSTTRKFGGTGLGLAICKQLVSLMDGQIAVSSGAGQGATFTVTLPLPPAEPSEMDEVDNVAVDLNGLRILVADDNAINQAVARAILEAFGATVTTACDGCEALDLLGAEAFDVVLMDVHMPRMGGIEALQEIRKDARLAHLPVIALTADAMSGFDTALRAAGFDDVAPKPISPGELALQIMGVVASATARQPEGDRQIRSA